MKSKIHELEGSEHRRGSKTENSPVRSAQLTSSGRSSQPHQRGANKPKVTKTQSSGNVTKSVTGVTGPGLSQANAAAGRTPQTKRRELSAVPSLSTIDKCSPNGSPRNVNRTSSSNSRKTGSLKSKSDQNRDLSLNNDESTKKNSSAHDKVTRNKQGATHSKSRSLPQSLRTASPEITVTDVNSRKRFEELCDIKNIELGMVKVPPEILEDLINKDSIEHFYDVDELPVASGIFATVRKCTHKESGIEYAAKYSSRLRYGVDCTMEVLHEIALLSICSESNKIVHLKDVFENKHEIILILEYAPGGDFQSVLDDDMVPFEQDVQGFMLQLLEALSFAHERNIAHLDIKPQNIVLMSEFPNCEIKLCDLEVSRVIQEHEEIREIIGTPDYVAPEILAYEPISLAADIWSLGVLAYVLLTGFSPFGGETDQETLRNITSAPLDFPSELFEGVSDEAKEFIKLCLNRNPLKRPSVEQCQKHSWIARDSEPPSPSPLMLKIPALDHFVSSPKLSVHPSVHHSPTGSSRRSCQTCRDKLSERKRYLSKSREAIFEKVTNSNLKKSLSKSRERLCDMRFTLGKSREYLNDSKVASRSQEKFHNFKSLSRSQEVLSHCLGGNMKRINGAVSDISPHHLPTNPRIYVESQDQDNCDFVMLPGSSVLMSHSELLSITGLKNSGSLQLLPISESGRSTPASICSNATVADIPYSGSNNDNNNDLVLSPCAGPSAVTSNNNITSKKSVFADTLVEIAEEDTDDDIGKNNNTLPKDYIRKKNNIEGSRKQPCNIKEEKNYLNYETKQNMNKSNGKNSNLQSKSNNSTSEVAIQVDHQELSSNLFLPKSELVMRRKEVTESQLSKTKADSSLSTSPSLTSLTSAIMQVDGNMRPGSSEKKLTRGFSHDNTLGAEQKRYSWREDLEKFRSMKKPLAVSDLIDAFSANTMQRKVSSNDSIFPSSVDGVKTKRRGSLQIQLDPKSLENLSSTPELSNDALKVLRRKSTSAIMPMRFGEVDSVKMVYSDAENKSNIATVSNEESSSKSEGERKSKLSDTIKQEQNEVKDEKDVKDEKPIKNEKPKESKEPETAKFSKRIQQNLNDRKRTWDYFEINHPKAISDKKLEQLKAKYNRRKTENNILSTVQQSETDGDKSSVQSPATHPTPMRTHSMPVFEGLVGSPLPKKSLDLAFDPLTGECLAAPVDTESIDSGRESEIVRKLSSDSYEESWKNDRDRAKTSVFGNKGGFEQIIPDKVVLECFIDPFTGQFITNEVAKEESEKKADQKDSVCNNNNRNGSIRNNLKVIVDKHNSDSSLVVDDGIGSLPITPTDLGKNKNLTISKRGKASTEDNNSLQGLASSESSLVSDQISVTSESRTSECNNSSQDVEEEDLDNANKVCLGSVSRGLEMFKQK